MDQDICPHCHSARAFGCKFGCPKKKPPAKDSPVSYEHWAAVQKEHHAHTHEKCMRPWSQHICPEERAR